MKKDLNSVDYWRLFGDHALPRDIQPTAKEAADHFISLLATIEKAKREVADAKHEAKCAHQEFKTFAMEVQNLAHKRQTFGANS